MGYFKKFGDIQYQGEQMQNLLQAVIPQRLNVDRLYIYQNHRIGDGETPESIAEKIYSDPQMYWTILVINNIINPYTEWPIPDAVIEAHTKKKYGTNDLTTVSHYYDNRIHRVCDDVDDAMYRQMPNANLPHFIIPVTILEYEIQANNAKREIVVVNPRYINQFVESYSKALEGQQP